MMNIGLDVVAAAFIRSLDEIKKVRSNKGPTSSSEPCCVSMLGEHSD